jgi:hypothetical protein
MKIKFSKKKNLKYPPKKLIFQKKIDKAKVKEIKLSNAKNFFI